MLHLITHTGEVHLNIYCHRRIIADYEWLVALFDGGGWLVAEGAVPNVGNITQSV